MKELNQINSADVTSITSFIQGDYAASRYFLLLQDDDQNTSCVTHKKIQLTRQIFSDLISTMGYDNFENLLLALKDFVKKDPQILGIIRSYLDDSYCHNENCVDITDMFQPSGITS